MEATLPREFTERDLVALMDTHKPKKMWLSVADTRRYISLFPERKYTYDDRAAEQREQDCGLRLKAHGVATVLDIDFDLADGMVRLEA